jgi:hypothetical protein
MEKRHARHESRKARASLDQQEPSRLVVCGRLVRRATEYIAPFLVGMLLLGFAFFLGDIVPFPFGVVAFVSRWLFVVVCGLV